MNDFTFIKTQYVKLRDSLIAYLEKFNDDSYFFQPTKVSNTPAWIIPHISAFEKIMVVDKISGYEFEEFISQENIDKYKPGVDAFSFAKEEMMSIGKAIELLKKTKDCSLKFLDVLIKNKAVSDVDRENAMEKYLLNISHETEHYGQLKYLLGTWKRLNES